MDFDLSAFSAMGDVLLTVDSHTGGEPTRLVVGGLPPIPGETINEKRKHIGEKLDYVRLLLTREPRGHRDMFAAIATEPTSEHGDFGLVFMDAKRYPYMCGHGTIGAVTTFIEMGWLDVPDDEEQMTVVVDTPSGVVQAEARLRHEAGRMRVSSVAIQLESAFAFALDQPVDVPGIGTLSVDVAMAGGFFAMVSADQIDIGLGADNAKQLAELGMAIIEASNAQLSVQHPTMPYINTVDVTEFYDPDGHPPAIGCNAVVYGEHHVDRSPCGTGTSAKMALMYAREQMDVGDVLVNRGLLDSTFEGRIVETTQVGKYEAIIPEIRGTAHITGLHRFVVMDDDPFPEGFLF